MSIICTGNWRQKMRWRINEQETKQLRMPSKQIHHQTVGLCDFKFEVVCGVTYLASVVGSVMKTSVGGQSLQRKYTKPPIPAHFKLLTSKLLSRNTKLKLHETLLRPILTCGSETGTITAEETNELRIFEEEDCKENIWTRKRRKMLDDNKRQGDKGDITRGR